MRLEDWGKAYDGRTVLFCAAVPQGEEGKKVVSHLSHVSKGDGSALRPTVSLWPEDDSDWWNLMGLFCEIPQKQPGFDHVIMFINTDEDVDSITKRMTDKSMIESRGIGFMIIIELHPELAEKLWSNMRQMMNDANVQETKAN